MLAEQAEIKTINIGLLIHVNTGCHTKWIMATVLIHNHFHDNLFCLFSDKTTEFVKNANVPVMGFKVLAAGAIEPEDGFR